MTVAAAGSGSHRKVWLSGGFNCGWRRVAAVGGGGGWWENAFSILNLNWIDVFYSSFF